MCGAAAPRFIEVGRRRVEVFVPQEQPPGAEAEVVVRVVRVWPPGRPNCPYDERFKLVAVAMTAGCASFSG